MKKLITTLILLGMIFGIYYYYNDIIDFVMYNFVYKEDFERPEANEYKRDYDFAFVQNTNDFTPTKKQDILNIIYTSLNNGWTNFTFFCPRKTYKKCLDDVEEITNDTTLVSNINNYIGTYNSYNKILVNINSFGHVNITVDRLYSDEEISKIKAKIDEIYDALITDNMTTEEKIRAFHNYIIDNTSYDEERSVEIKSNTITSLKHPSNTAYGPLFTGKAICGGYTDAMALFLDKLGLKNYKVSSEKHIWNLVEIDGKWKHLDLTWDDPVVNTGIDLLIDTYFLIDTNTLLDKEKTQHNFNSKVFIEAK